MRQYGSVATHRARLKARSTLTLSGLLALMAFGVGVSACGQKGPLTLPKAASAASTASAPTR